jgi:hypothetical protein
MAVALKDINLEQLSTEQLIGLDRALGTFVFKQPASGENYHSTYRRDKQSFDLLAKTTVSLQRAITTYFSDLAGNIKKLVDVQKIIAADTLAGYFNADEWDDAEEELVQILHKGLMPIYEVGAKATAKELGVGTNITSHGVPSQEFLRKYSLQLAGDLTKETKSRVKETIKTSLALGEDRNTLTEKLSDILDDDYRAQMIAQTESIRAYSQGRLAVGEELGYKQKRWEWPGDSDCKVCPDLADQGAIDIDDTWELDNGEEIDAPPGHPNCRCSIRLIKGEDDIEGKEDLLTIKGGWITRNGAHIFIPDGPEDAPTPAKIKDIGKNSTTDKTFVERSEGVNLGEKLKGGSVREVYDVGDNKVVKIANSPRGLEQNDAEGDWFLIDEGLLPTIHERGADYVIVDKAKRDDSKARTFLKPIASFSAEDFDNKTGPLQEAMEKMKIDALLNYDVLWGDIKAPRNWGFIKGKPVLTDAGALTKNVYFNSPVSKATQTDWDKVLVDRRAYISAVKGSEAISASVIRGGWITMNGNHIYIADTPEDLLKNSTGKTLGQIQREHEAATGLSSLTEFQDAMSANNFEKADKLYKVIQDAKPDSPLAAYKSSVASLYKSHKEAVMGDTAFAWDQYKDLNQSEMNIKVYEQFATDFPADAPSLESFNFAIKEVPVNTIDDNVAGLPDRALRYAEDMRNGDKFPPLVVLHFGGNNNLADGAHRVEALKINNVKMAKVLYGTPR